MMTRFKRQEVVDENGNDRTIDLIIISGGQTRYGSVGGTVYDATQLSKKVTGDHVAA